MLDPDGQATIAKRSIMNMISSSTTGYRKGQISNLCEMSWPVFLTTSRTLFARANLMPSATWLAAVALIVYTGKFPKSHCG